MQRSGSNSGPPKLLRIKPYLGAVRIYTLISFPVNLFPHMEFQDLRGLICMSAMNSRSVAVAILLDGVRPKVH